MNQAVTVPTMFPSKKDTESTIHTKRPPGNTLRVFWVSRRWQVSCLLDEGRDAGRKLTSRQAKAPDTDAAGVQALYTQAAAFEWRDP